LLDQITELKTTLREIASRVSNIERHVRRAFRVAKSPTPSASSPRPPRTSLPPPTLTRSQALSVFDELSPLLENQGREAVERRLSSLELSDLKLIVQELGVPLPSKPSRKALGAAILGRVNESRLLTRNRNVTSRRSKPNDA